MTYVALLRGINVGGNSMIRMSELKECLENAGFADVRTYIQSGNVIFATPKTATARLAQKMEAAIEKKFAINVGVAVFSAQEWQEIVRRAPNWWGKKTGWKHNLLALLPGTKPSDVIAAMGALKPEIEQVTAGPGVVYQSLSMELFGKTTSSKLPSHPLYRRVTVRNYNTTVKLAALLTSTGNCAAGSTP
ncbi:MAG: DUF1697 domain-containing protein [Chthoniobacterales bacterium]